MSIRVLQIDDNLDFMDKHQQKLAEMGIHLFDCLRNPDLAVEKIAKDQPNIVLLDAFFDGVNKGKYAYSNIRSNFPDLPIIILTENIANPEMGLDDYDNLIAQDPKANIVTKDSNLKKIKTSIYNLLKSDNSTAHLELNFVSGNTPKMQEVIDKIQIAAGENISVLIKGETGTGKELVAEAIHENSSRKNMKFVKVDCGAIAQNLIESELFGHRKGSFTGAHTDKTGKFEEANGGTILLDEIGDMEIELQKRLLRVLQEKRFCKVGGTGEISVDVKIIAATHRNLEELIGNGQFREDLYYRLNEMKIELPPLRERIEDIEELYEYFIDKLNNDSKNNFFITPQIMPPVKDLLMKYTWPGNIREMEKKIIVAYAKVKSRGKYTFIRVSDFDGFNNQPVNLNNEKTIDELTSNISYIKKNQPNNENTFSEVPEYFSDNNKLSMDLRKAAKTIAEGSLDKAKGEGGEEINWQYMLNLGKLSHDRAKAFLEEIIRCWYKDNLNREKHDLNAKRFFKLFRINRKDQTLYNSSLLGNETWSRITDRIYTEVHQSTDS